MGYILRPYQQEAADKAVVFLLSKKKYNGIEILPTGSGKSLVIADVARQLDEHVLILQPGKEILEQNFAKYISYGNYATIFSASMNQKKISKVTFATIGSVINKMEDFSHFKYLIVDECHFVNPQKGMYKQLNDFLNVKILGLTATPYRLSTDGWGGSMLKFITRTRPKVFREIIYAVQIKDLLDQGYLAPIEYIPDNDFDRRLIQVNSTGADFDEKALRAYLADIHQDDKAILAIKHNLHRKGIICFVPYIENAQYISDSIDDACIVTSKTKKKERAAILTRFRNGDISAIINVGILTTGFDYPELDTIILTRPTMSLALYYQMIGRGIRPHKDKPNCRVIDLTDNYQKFGKIEDLNFVEDGVKSYYESKGRQLTNVYLDDEYAKAREERLQYDGVIRLKQNQGYTMGEMEQENVEIMTPFKRGSGVSAFLTYRI